MAFGLVNYMTLLQNNDEIKGGMLFVKAYLFRLIESS